MVSHPKQFFEIELKALLTKSQFYKLQKKLLQKLKLFNEDTIHTIKFKPGDIRLRHSKKISEIVFKEGRPTDVCRRELIIPVRSKRRLDYFKQLFKLLNFSADPPWIKHKKEFIINFSGYGYIVCLQHIENFAYLMEAEFLSPKEDSKIHVPNLKKIIQNFGLGPVDPQKLLKKIDQYINQN